MAKGGDYGDDMEHLLKDYEPVDNYDDDAVQESLSTTQPFKPGQASTPYHGGEQMEMQTMQHEHTGLPSYAETSFGGEPTPSTEEISARLSRLSASRENLGINRKTGILDIPKIPNPKENPLSEEDKKQQIVNARCFIKNRFPQAEVEKLVISYSSKNPLELVVKGPKGIKDGRDLQQQALDKTFIKNILGLRGDLVITRASEEIRKKQKILEELR